MDFDIEIRETGNGGDVKFEVNDFVTINGIENQPYLAMLGGNLEASTEPERTDNAQDFWANTLLFRDSVSTQMNSTVERTINNVGLNSAGRIIIENAVKEDLKYLSPAAKIKVDVIIVATDQININIAISTDVDKQQNVSLVFILGSDGDWVISDFNDDFNI